MALLEEAVRRAEADSGAKLLGELGSLDVVNFLSWRYRDPEKQLAARLGASPAHCYYGPVGGESPIRYIHEAAQSASRAANAAWPWSAARKRNPPQPRPSAAASRCRGRRSPHDVEEPKRGAAFQKPMAVKLGVFRPITVYPLYESATSAHWGRTPREALAESGALWSTYSQVASENQNSWLKKHLTPDEITTPTRRQPVDRVALYKADGGQSDREHGRRGDADQSLAKARAAGVPEDRADLSDRRRLGGRAARLS